MKTVVPKPPVSAIETDKASLIAYGKAVEAIPCPDFTTEEGKKVWSMVKSAVDNALVDLDDLLKEMA